jgi:hypothetical protein
MEWTTAVSVLRAGKQTYENRHTIQHYWTRLKAYLDTGATQVVVTGHPGAGKSVLVAQMHGRARDLAFDVPGESRQVEVDAIQLGDWTKLVRVLPGQTGHRTAGEIEAFQDNASLAGVIHLVDFGFVAPRDSVLAEALLNQDGIDTIEKLRKHNLRIELESLRLLLADIRKLRKSNNAPKWLIIAVNKVDLFNNTLNQALAHYHPAGLSEFSKVLRDFRNEIGSANFGIYIVPVCAYETNFSWNNEEVESALDAQQQHKILREFVQTVAAITNHHDE